MLSLIRVNVVTGEIILYTRPTSLYAACNINRTHPCLLRFCVRYKQHTCYNARNDFPKIL